MLIVSSVEHKRNCHTTQEVVTYKGVTWLDCARGKKQVGAPMFELEVFRKQMYCIEESACDIAGPFRRPPQWCGSRGIAPPSLHPWIRPTYISLLTVILQVTQKVENCPQKFSSLYCCIVSACRFVYFYLEFK